MAQTGLVLEPKMSLAIRHIPRLWSRSFLRYYSITKDSLAEKRNPRNDDILSHTRVAQLVDPTTNALSPTPTRITDILEAMDHKVSFLELVSTKPPIVKYINKLDQLHKKQAAKERKRISARVNVLKEIQVTWGVEAGDWAHKMGKVRTELLKGRKVDIAFAPKSGKKPPTREDMMAKLNGVVEEMKDIGEEWQPMDIKKAVAVIHLRGLPQNAQRHSEGDSS